MSGPPPRSYLLRLWREHANAPVRLTVISVSQPDDQRHFATLDAMCLFLRTQANEIHCMNQECDTTDCTALTPR